MFLRELTHILEAIAPISYAEPWDNVGLLVGEPAQNVQSVLLTIDYTAQVAEEASRLGCNVVIAYHPPIFEGLKKIQSSHLVYDAIRRGIALYSPHTALDVAEGGTNDVLADAVGLQERVPLRKTRAKDDTFKLVTFVPETYCDTVSEALFQAGAGRIGAYSSCSFRGVGVGTFYGSEQANPTIGLKGRLERVDEVRVEMVVQLSCIEQVIKALRATHPYEEPAFDLIRLAALPESRGLGRFGTRASIERAELFEIIKTSLDLKHILVSGPTHGAITRVAVGAGACGDLINDALSKKAELYLTGELRHHDALKAASAGMTVVCTLHSNSERATLKRLKQRLIESASNLNIFVSEVDRDPFVVV